MAYCTIKNIIANMFIKALLKNKHIKLIKLIKLKAYWLVVKYEC